MAVAARPAATCAGGIGAITAAYSYDGGKPVTAEDLGAAGAMTVLLKDALKPNLVQTLEGQPVMMHCGPFANIAHGNNSLIADMVGMKLGDYVVTESGFGSDMGMEKFFDIVCRFGKLTPSAAVLVTTVRAIKHHGGVEDDPRVDRAASIAAIEEGMANVRRHLGIIRTFGVPAVVAVNRRPGDTDEEVELVKRLAIEAGAFDAQVNEGFEKGGVGAADLAEAVVEACDQPNDFHFLYPDDAPIREKIEAVATQGVRRQGRVLLPRGRAEDRAVQPRRARATSRCAWPRPTCRCPPTRRCSTRPRASRSRSATSAPTPAPGWLVPLCGDIQQMPGLGKSPAALNIDIDDGGPDGRAVLMPAARERQ